jgi:hypothetical protein
MDFSLLLQKQQFNINQHSSDKTEQLQTSLRNFVLTIRFLN